ncbi:MAG TPA: methionine adenosyltransferase [Halanaerobiales bacterium]|nr:methionine adenosyltransferase [Halanaerobiales bacterium]
MAKNYMMTSESVTEGHPDKVADKISDSILDAILKHDQDARVACETFVTTGLAFISGEITTDCYVDVTDITRQTIMDIGYDRAKYGFDGETCGVITSIKEQSADIALGVNHSFETKTGNEEEQIGAGDQGIMYGYATNETEEYMPLPINLAHKLAQRLADVRKKDILDYLRPDGKTQVTIEYEDDIPKRVDKVLISAQHHPEVAQETIKRDLCEFVIKNIIPENMLDKNTDILINPTGRFVIGGPHGDAGLTGRKIIVDTYGGTSRHGGGAFSGKDPTKVDRSASYAARYVAKNIVAAGLAEKCEVQLSYAIGVAYPLSVMVETFNTAKVSEERLVKVIKENFELTPGGIINKFDLMRPIYSQLTNYGHFGRLDLDLPWEELDKVEIIKNKV